MGHGNTIVGRSLQRVALTILSGASMACNADKLSTSRPITAPNPARLAVVIDDETKRSTEVLGYLNKYAPHVAQRLDQARRESRVPGSAIVARAIIEGDQEDMVTEGGLAEGWTTVSATAALAMMGSTGLGSYAAGTDVVLGYARRVSVVTQGSYTQFGNTGIRRFT